MSYDFDTVICRDHAGSTKWEEMEKVLGYCPEGIIPFSVADMEFVTAPEIVRGLKQFLDENPLGYAVPTPEYKEAVVRWMKRRHHWEIKTEWILDTPGVINAFFTAVKAFTLEGEGVMLMTPVYYPMYYAVERNRRVLVENKLIREGDTYRIDFDDFEKKARDENTKLLILCSPHNPTGRVWTREELERIGRICQDNHVLVVSDEIHFDLIMPDYHHWVYASLGESFAQNSIICTAPSKSFNLAGLQTSNIVIANPQLRSQFHEEMKKVDGNPKCNILGLEGCRLAYEYAEGWLEQVITVIDTNRRLVTEFIRKELPDIQVMKLEGTCLLWMDFNGLGIDCYQMSEILKREAKLFFDDGYLFGEAGAGFQRWNLACPTKYILPALVRLKETVWEKH